jgi:hypothetical protein
MFRNRFSVTNLIKIRIIERVMIEKGYTNKKHVAANFRNASIESTMKDFFW